MLKDSVAFISSIGFGALYWIVIKYTKAKLRQNSQVIANQSDQMVKSLQENLETI